MVCVCVCGVYVQVHMCVRPEDNLRCFSSDTVYPGFETEPLAGPELTKLDCLVSEPKDPLVSGFSIFSCKANNHAQPLFVGTKQRASCLHGKHITN